MMVYLPMLDRLDVKSEDHVESKEKEKGTY